MTQKYSNFRELTDSLAARFGARTAFRIKHKSADKPKYEDKTYNDFTAEVKVLASAIVRHNLHKKPIAIIGKNRYEWALSYFAVLYASGTVAPFDKALTETELARQTELSEIGAVFCGGEFVPFFEERGIAAFGFDSEKYLEMLSCECTEELPAVNPNKASILLFTSGTTSKAKIVMLSQKNILENLYSLSLHEKFYPDDVSAALLPFHHAFGMTQTVLFLSLGMCTVFCDGLRIARCLNEYGVSVLVVVPRIIDEIKHAATVKMQNLGLLNKFNRAIKISAFLNKTGIDIRRIVAKKLIDNLGGRLRFIIVGAAPATPDTLKWFNDAGILTVNGYGLTETSPTLTAESDKYMRKGSVGKPLYGVDIKIIDPNSDGVGEIAARGENVMLGYMKNDAANAAVFRDGYFLTGDMGYIDKDGYLFITGRKKNVIVLPNGKNVFPEEIEELINRAVFVKECIVKEKDGFICATIVYKNAYTHTAATLAAEPFIEKLNAHLPDFKKIRFYELTDKEFEKTSTLKIKR